MKLTIPQHVLLKPLTQASTAVSNKMVIPILDGIYFNVTFERMEIIGGDGVTMIKTSISADQYQTDGSCAFVLPHKKTVEAVKMMTGDVSFTVKGNEVILQSGRSKVTMLSADPEEYPILENVIGQEVTIPGKSLKEVVDKTIYAVAEAKSQASILTGLLFEIASGEMKVTGCDRHRLASVKVQLKEDIESALVVKGEDVVKIMKSISEKEEVSLTFGSSQIQVEVGDTQVIARTLEGSYPDTTKLIPPDYETVITVLTKEFLRALEFAKVVATGKNSVVKMTVEDEIRLEATSDNGVALQTVQIDKKNGAHIKLSFNANYVVETVKSIDHEFTTIKCKTNLSPVIFRGEGREEETYIVLPYRVAE